MTEWKGVFRRRVLARALGVDIACRMRMTVLDLPASALETP